MTDIRWKKQISHNQFDLIYNRELGNEKTQNIEFYAEIIAEEINLSEKVIQGIIYLSIKNWEKKHRLNFAKEARGENAVKVASELNDLIKERLKRMAKANQDDLIDSILNYTLQKFSKLGASGVI